MIFLNNKVKSILLALVIITIIFSLSSVSANDNITDADDVIKASGEIYISPDGTGSGESEDSPTNWYSAYSSAENGNTIVFTGGNYTWNTMETVSKSLILRGNGDSEAVIDAHNQTGFLRITAGTTLQLVNLTFYDAQTGDTDTGSILNNGVLIVNDCYFAEGKGWGTKGGAIHNYGKCEVYNSTFYHNTAAKGGSINSDENSDLYVYNCLFVKGSSKEGNCINVKEATANIYNCNFVNSSAKTGIIYTKKSNVNIYNCNFTNSRAVDYAAAVDVDKESTVLIDNCIFDKLTSVGGVIWFTDGKKIGTGDGGAVYVEKGGSLTIKNSKFSNCNAKANGGALYIESKGDAVVDNCSFINNTAAEGRHIYIEGTAPTITNSLFEVNNTLKAFDVESGSDEVVDISVDVGTNFMSYNIPVKMGSSEVYTVTMENSDVTLKGLADGEYSVELDNNDKVSTNKYLFSQESVSFKVGNANSSGNTTPDNKTDDNKTDENTTDTNGTYILEAPEVELYYKNGTRFYAYLTDNQSNGISGNEIIINVNGMDNKRTSDENGSASIAINLIAGVYDVKVTAGNLSVNSKITVLSTINAKDITKVFRNATQFYANFTNGEGLPLANKEVKFNINGVFYNRTTNENGTARLNINLNQGTYIITSTNPENGEENSNTIIVTPKITENNNLVKFYKNDSQYVVKLIDDDGNPVGAGISVTFNINGVFYTRTTNESGLAKLNINLAPGDYIITAEYADYKVSNNITVKPVLIAQDLDKVYGDTKAFSAYLLDGQGNPLSGENITYNINGVFYNRATDSDGISRLNINLQAGEYIITSTYNGCNIANKVTITSV